MSLSPRTATSLGLGIALCAALGAPAAAAGAPTAFAGTTSVRSVDAACLTNGPARGRVAIEVRVRYAGTRSALAARYAERRHRVSSAITVLDRRGRTIARHSDRGSARTTIPTQSGYEHAHKHLLGRAASRKLLAGSGCKAGSSAVVRVRVRATQSLGAQASATPRASAPIEQQEASTTAAAVVVPASDHPVVNGCSLLGMDTNCHGVDLHGAQLGGSVLPYSDFSFASLAGSDLSNARLGHVIMNLTDLTNANMRGAQIGSAGLTSAILAGTDLTGAAAPFANFGNATFTNAKLEGANLIAANLHGVTFTNTSCDGNTKLPAIHPFRCVNGLVVG